MLRSRVLSSIDTSRLADAVSRPGIDPRIWVSYAVLISEPVIVTDEKDQDIIADIMLLPSGTIETARVGAAYAGDGFGLYAPLHIDDEVLVVAPSGDPDQGLVITQRLWSPAALPPAEAQANPEDWTLVVEPDKNLRLNVKGSGNVYLIADTGKVILGDADATRGVARLDDTVMPDTNAPVPPSLINMATWMATVTATLNALSPGALPGVPPIVGTINSASGKVVSS